MSAGPTLLLDAYSLVYRAFYALPPMTTRSGTPTGALYGVSMLLVKLLREERPRAVAFAVDLPGPTHRQETYAAYKAGRAATPDPLRDQLLRLPELARALDAPLHRVRGWEADDVLATLCTAPEVRPALVVSGDTDLLQVVDPGATVLFVGRRQKEHVRYDVDAVRARYGFDPAGIPTFKALAGDPSDNLPGIPGIGAKTAKTLVASHGTAARILDARAGLTPRVRAALDAHGEQLLAWEALATVRRDLALREPGRDGAPPQPLAGPLPPLSGLRAWFEGLEFRSLLPRLDAIEAARGAEAAR